MSTCDHDLETIPQYTCRTSNENRVIVLHACRKRSFKFPCFSFDEPTMSSLLPPDWKPPQKWPDGVAFDGREYIHRMPPLFSSRALVDGAERFPGVDGEDMWELFQLLYVDSDGFVVVVINTTTGAPPLGRRVNMI